MAEQNTNDIFLDRRSHRPGAIKNCRRQSDFGRNVTDARPWWLKVNYVIYHTTTFDNTEALPQQRK